MNNSFIDFPLDFYYEIKAKFKITEWWTLFRPYKLKVLLFTIWLF